MCRLRACYKEIFNDECMASVDREDGVFPPVCSSFSAWFDFEMHSCRGMDMGFSCILWGPQLHTHMRHSSACLVHRQISLKKINFLACSLWDLSLADNFGHFLYFQGHLLSACGMNVLLLSCNIYMKQLLEVCSCERPGATCHVVGNKIAGHLRSSCGSSSSCVFLILVCEHKFSCLNQMSLLRSSLLNIFLLSSPIGTCAKDIGVS